MNKKRRNFLMTTGLAVGGFASAGFASTKPGDLIGQAERDVLSAISRYGSNTSRQRSGTNIRFVVKMRDFDAFRHIFTVEPAFENIVASGNRLSFDHRGVKFTLDNRC